MFDITLANVIEVVIISLVFILMMFIIVRVYKNAYGKYQAHVVEGWNNKKRGILRTDNAELRGAGWKVEFWRVLLVVSFTMPVVALGLSAILGNLSSPLVVSFLGIGAPTALYAAFMWQKRRREFYQLKDELGVELEYNEDKIRKASSGLYAVKFLGIPFVFIHAFVLLVLVIMMVAIIVSGGFSVATAITGIIVVYNIPILVKQVQFYMAARRRGKQEP